MSSARIFLPVLLAGVLLPVPCRAASPAPVRSRPPSYDVVPLPRGSDAQSIPLSDRDLALLEKLNRVDRKTMLKQPDVVAPREWGRDETAYAPFPEWLPWADEKDKTIVVHKPLQAFAAYEKGRLVHWGPVSTGVRPSLTPAGLYHLNWRARGHRSTVNRNWYLPWYFNFSNVRGLSFHEYVLPGRPASHGCIRMLARDARWVYDWGSTWKLDERGRKVEQPGTPVVIVGEYPHQNQTPPWRDPGLLASGFAAARSGTWLAHQVLALAGAEFSFVSAEPIEGASLE